MVRQLKTQVSLPAVLPHGPLQQQHDPFDPLVELYRTTDQNFADLTMQTMAILQGSPVKMLTALAKKASGRKDPSSFGET